MPLRVLLLDHLVSPTPTDAVESELAARQVEIVSVRPESGDSFPDMTAFDGIVALGGPASAYDEAAHSWLREEKAAIGEAVRSGLPYWGVCLGAQLLAAALGGEVHPGPEPEIGAGDVDLLPAAAADPVFSLCPPSFRTFQWHRDGFAIPPGGRRLATSRLYPNQAFAWGAAYGLQFHLEPTPEVVRGWIAQSSGTHAGYSIDDRAMAIIEDAVTVAPAANRLSRALLGRWLDLIRDRGFADADAID
ncbi:MAG TPA: type 1 glutamine amidotransferase [Solirubrobacterales bacterium]